MVPQWSLSDNKSLHVSTTLPSLLADLINAVIWMVSTLPLISKSSSPCTNPLVTVPRALITIGIIVTFVFHSFFNSLTRSMYFSLFSHFFNITLFFFFFFFFGYYKIWSSDRDLVTRLYLEIPEEFMRLILKDRLWVCIYDLFVGSNFNFLHNSQ